MIFFITASSDLSFAFTFSLLLKYSVHLLIDRNIYELLESIYCEIQQLSKDEKHLLIYLIN